MKVIDAVFATSSSVQRAQLVFDPSTGLIVDFGQLGVPVSEVDWHYGDDCIAFAGMGDIHIHAREDVSQKHVYKEDYQTASAAAINGGVTHVADMPNNPIPPIDDESYFAKLALTTTAPVPVLLYAGIGPQTHPLKAQVPYKAYMGPSVGELFFRDDQELEVAISRYPGRWVSFHCEDPVEMTKHKHESEHHLQRPVECEVLATRTALSLIEKYQLQGKLCHYSAGEGLDLIRAARSRGVKVQCEVTPQHLYFSQSELGERRHYFQMNPPIRDSLDRDLMLAAARNGEIDFLATDHAPHTTEEKQQGISGLTGLDSYGAFVTWLLREKNFTPQRIALMACENPATFTNHFMAGLAQQFPRYQQLGLGLGFLKKGYSAQVTVLNLKKSTVFGAESLKTKVGHNPFVGITFPGRVEQVFLQGRAQK